MVYFPVRKCYYAVKISVVLMLVIFVLAFFEKWKGGKKNARAQYSDPQEEAYEREILDDEARIIAGLGEGGVAAHLVGEDKKLGEESEKKLAINVHLSDRIAYNRTLKDFRNPACKRVTYDAELPSASVVIIFHNEPYSVIVRTIWSVLNSARRSQPWYKLTNYVDRESGKTMTLGYPGQDPSSPFVYLKEIILVDDNSTLPELKGKLSHYVRTRLPPDLIRILRLPDRRGLILARMRGARSARGDVLIFLDAHCEVNADWLRPLLQRIRHKRDAVLTPLIDIIDETNFSLQAAMNFQVGGFTFMGHFNWIEVPEREKKRRGSDISPTWSPTMAGGLFAMSRAYYWELGAYDEQMAGWGGENLEMSFRVWQCGGTLETIPCSRVGHVFRSFHPYGLPPESDTHGINTARMAEVWMDEYAELFYLHRPDLRNNPKIGDVTHRKVLREKLKCKSFQWYLDNIYKEKFVPVKDVYGFGRFVNPASNMCLDTLQREGGGMPLGVYPCHEKLQATQYLSLSASGQLRDEENCAELQHIRGESGAGGRLVLMMACHEKHRAQKWRHLPSGQLQHVQSGLCLSAGLLHPADVLAAPCGSARPDQKWLIDYNQDNDFRMSADGAPTEQEARLRKLRGQRRISRSLLTYDETPDDLVSKKSAHRRTHKKKRSKKRAKKHGKRKRTKDKFILKLVRSLPNRSEEHLEVDIHCKHRQLFPNNSFVRDLVAILNENNIKVINNGRVFEKNKVSQLKSRGGGDPDKVLHKMDIAPTAEPLANFVTERTFNTNSYDQKKVYKVDFAPAEGLNNIVPQKGKQWRPGKKKHKVQPLAPLDEPQKKIIIEDFVEVISSAPEPMVSGKRRKHKKVPHQVPQQPIEESRPPAEDPLAAEGEEAFMQLVDEHTRQRVTQDSEEEALRVNLPSSAEEPMASSAELQASTRGHDPDRFSEDEQWPNSDRRSRSKPARRSSCSDPLHHDSHKHQGYNTEAEMSDRVDRALPETGHTGGADPPTMGTSPKREDLDSETGDKADEKSSRRSRGSSQAPVKLVMRSNLTFNLGDDFFKWKKPASVADLIGELSIPNSTPSPEEESVRIGSGVINPAASPTESEEDDTSSSESNED